MNDNYIAYVNSYNKLVSTDSTSDFTVMINLPKNNNFNKVVVLQMAIPKSYYLVQNGYNTFHVYEPTNLTYHLVTLLAGNYTRVSFMAELTRGLNNATPACAGIYTVTFSSSTGKWTYTESTLLLSPSIITTNNLFEQLGFSLNTTNTFVSLSGGGSKVDSSNCVKLQQEDTLFVISDCSNALSGVLQEVYCNSSDYSNITFSQYNEDLYAKTFIRNNNNVFRFSLTDENFRPINLNGLNMNMTLCFYRVEPLPPIGFATERVALTGDNVAKIPPLPSGNFTGLTNTENNNNLFS
jgi:hypothetical protein